MAFEDQGQTLKSSIPSIQKPAVDSESRKMELEFVFNGLSNYER